MESVSYDEVVSACEYMGEDARLAFTQGPVVGAARVAYVKAHKGHATALESGDTCLINAAWEVYCKARSAFMDSLYC